MDTTLGKDKYYSCNVCPWCGGMHTGVCSLVESIEYYENGVIKKVTFKTK